MIYQFVGTVAGAENATVRATVTYLSDYRAPDGQIVPPVLLFEKLPGQEWAAQPDGGPAVVWGPNTNTDGVPRVRVAYTVLRDGLPPFSRVVERRIMPNTDTPGFWDWTRSDEVQPLFVGGTAQPTPIEVLPGQGPQGERGPGLLMGAGVPNPEAGRNGDSYLNTATWDVYSKSAGNWTLVGNIRGATGGMGPRGEAGLGVPTHTVDENGAVLVAGNGSVTTTWKHLADLGLTLELLSDVDLGGLADGQTLVYDLATQKWRPGIAIGSGGGGTGTLDTEGVQDVVAAMLVAGTGVTLAYDDEAGKLTLSAAGGQGVQLAGIAATTGDLPASGVAGEARLVTADGYVYIWDGTAWQKGSLLRGPTGEKGAAGAQGERGIQGATGPQGPKGDKGDKGDTGPQGPAGPAGSGTGGTTLPAASAPGQILVANSKTPGDVGWKTASALALVTPNEPAAPNLGTLWKIPGGPLVTCMALNPVAWEDATGAQYKPVAVASAYSYYRLTELVNSYSGNTQVALTEWSARADAGGDNILVGGVATASDQSANAARLFDGDQYSEWVGQIPATITYQLPLARQMASYTLRARAQYAAYSCPGAWKLQGSNDGETWTTLHTVTNEPTWNDSEMRTYTI